MVLELNAPEDPAPGAPRAERMAAIRKAATAVKQRFLQRIEALRRLDPDMQVDYTSSGSPLIVVRSTKEVFRRLRQDPEVRAMSPERDGELLSSTVTPQLPCNKM